MGIISSPHIGHYIDDYYDDEGKKYFELKHDDELVLKMGQGLPLRFMLEMRGRMIFPQLGSAKNYLLKRANETPY